MGLPVPTAGGRRDRQGGLGAVPSLVCERHSRSGQTSNCFFDFCARRVGTGRGAGV